MDTVLALLAGDYGPGGITAGVLILGIVISLALWFFEGVRTMLK